MIPSDGQWNQPELNYFGTDATKNQNYVGEVNGRPMVESDMPESLAYQHPIRSYGNPRRLSVYDMTDSTKRSSNNERGLVSDPNGEPGLVGAADFYREPERKAPNLVTVDEKGNIVSTPGKPFADVNVGYIQSATQGKGIGRQMFDYMLNTTPKNSTLNVGRAVSDETLHMAEKAAKEKPGSVSYKRW